MRLAIIPPHTPTYMYIALNNEGTSLAIAIHTPWWCDPSSPVVHGWHWSHLWMASHIHLLCHPQWWIHWPLRKYVNRFPVFVYYFNSWLWFIHLMSQLTPIVGIPARITFSCISVALVVSMDAMHMVTDLFDTMNPTVIYCWVNRVGCRDWQLQVSTILSPLSTLSTSECIY